MRRLLIVLLLLSPLPARAWNDTGHRLAAAIAFDAMTPAARREAFALLRRNPDFAAWTTGFAPAEQPRIAFIQASTWADDIKDRPDYSNAREDLNAPDATRLIGYADRRQHRAWHFIDIGFSPDGTPVPPPPRANAVSIIEEARRLLAQGHQGDGDARSYALVWLIHLVADVHQPLHAAERVTARQPRGDRGGNDVEVCAPRCGGNLHSLWDGLPGDRMSFAALDARRRQLPHPPAAAVAVTDPMAWARESHQIARRHVYTAAIGTDGAPIAIDAAYLRQARAVADAQVALAGARLAALLNAALR